MRVHISAQGLDITPSIRTYIETKLGSLSRFAGVLDKKDQIKMLVEVGRITRRHRHGVIYRVAADLNLPPKNVLRAEEISEDIRAAIDAVRDKLSCEIKKRKTRTIAARRS